MVDLSADPLSSHVPGLLRYRIWLRYNTAENQSRETERGERRGQKREKPLQLK